MVPSFVFCTMKGVRHCVMRSANLMVAYDYIANCARINCGMEQPLTGSNPENRGMRNNRGRGLLRREWLA